MWHRNFFEPPFYRVGDAFVVGVVSNDAISLIVMEGESDVPSFDSML